MLTATSLFYEGAMMTISLALANVMIFQNIYVPFMRGPLTSGPYTIGVQDFFAKRMLFVMQIVCMGLAMLLMFVRKFYTTAMSFVISTVFCGLMVRHLTDMLRLAHFLSNIDQNGIQGSAPLYLMKLFSSQYYFEPIAHVIALGVCTAASFYLSVKLIMNRKVQEHNKA